ncbi:MAG: glycosyltransferase family 39 protein [Thermoanaerobaculia bacterium]
MKRAGFWVVGAAIALAIVLRPATPIDETRYLTVAWEMWSRGDALVPHLNGEPYSHKPPLLFWLMHAGWSLVGPSEIWARLVPGLAALAVLAGSRRLAARLWADEATAAAVPAALAGSLAFLVVATFTGFDMLLAACVSIAWNGLVDATDPARRGRGWTTFAAGLGLGILTKGPVALLLVLPAALAAPWWAAGSPAVARGRRGRWYAALALAVVAGAALALAWAIPAAIRGGPQFRDAIFVRQTAGRVVESFAHRRPFWWYVPIAPLLLLPLALAPAVRRGWARALARPLERGARFALAATLPAFVGFSLVSGKQPQYLLPLLPAAAMLAARAARLGSPAERAPARALGAFAVVSLVLFAALHVVFAWKYAAAYDLEPFSRRIGELQAAGRPVGFLGAYHGQFGFLGRLSRPLLVQPSAGAEAFFRRHPDGVLVAEIRRGDGSAAGRREILAQPYRGGRLVAWEATGAVTTPSTAPDPNARPR